MKINFSFKDWSFFWKNWPFSSRIDHFLKKLIIFFKNQFFQEQFFEELMKKEKKEFSFFCHRESNLAVGGMIQSGISPRFVRIVKNTIVFYEIIGLARRGPKKMLIKWWINRVIRGRTFGFGVWRLCRRGFCWWSGRRTAAESRRRRRTRLRLAARWECPRSCARSAAQSSATAGTARRPPWTVSSRGGRRWRGDCAGSCTDSAGTAWSPGSRARSKILQIKNFSTRSNPETARDIFQVRSKNQKNQKFFFLNYKKN